MLDDQQLDAYFARHHIEPQARAVIRHIRQSEPSRNVAGTRRNLACRFASRKMGRTIQAESHTNELAALWLWEHDPCVHEFWDQPPPQPVRITRRDRRTCGVQKTADFFLLQEGFAGWVECKTRAWLENTVQEGDVNFELDDQGRWHYRPGEAAAQKYGLGYAVRLAEDNNPALVDNLKLLSDYLTDERGPADKAHKEAILTLLDAHGRMPLADLLRGPAPADADTLYGMIADGELLVDLERDRLAEPQRCRVFRDAMQREVYGAYADSHDPKACLKPSEVDLASGKRIVWDGAIWTIANRGEESLTLMADGRDPLDFPLHAMLELIGRGKVHAEPASPESEEAERVARLRSASPQALERARLRYRALFPETELSPVPDDPSPATSPRTLRSWRAMFRRGLQRYGNGFLGLIDETSRRGNRGRKYDPRAIQIVHEVIKAHYLNADAPSIKTAWGIAIARCGDAIRAPSEKTFSREIRRLTDETARQLARAGDKAAYQVGVWYWHLEDDTPRHGQRPFEIGHVDHTQIDLQLIDERFDRKTRKCWATAMIDAYSRVVLALFLTFDEPSYRSVMGVVRECVRRHGRIPDTLVLDNASEFRSIYADQLLAFLGTHKKLRPKGAPRHGSVIERLFKRMNEDVIHQLRGNNKALQSPRSMARTHDPRLRTTWTIDRFRDAFEQYVYTVYAQLVHQTLGVAPQQAFEAGMRDFGSRAHRRIAYDEAFLMLCLPSTTRGRAKVQPGGRVKINYLHYYAPRLALPKTEGTEVPVRYDPLDVSRAYAFAGGEWTLLESEDAALFRRYTEKEIEAASKEIRDKFRHVYRNRSINARMLADYLLNLERLEAERLAQAADGAAPASVPAIAPALSPVPASLAAPPPSRVNTHKRTGSLAERFSGLKTEEYGEME